MVYTHDFDLQLGSMHVEGEFGFGTDGPPGLKTTNGYEVTIPEDSQLNNFFVWLTKMNSMCGDVSRVEFIKKG